MQARAISEFSSQLQFGETGKPKESQFRASGSSSFLSVAQSIIRNTTPGDGGDTQTESAGVTVELASALPNPDSGSKGGTVTVVKSHASLVVRSYVDEDGNVIQETERTEAKLRAVGTPDAPPVIEIDLPDSTVEPSKEPTKLEVADPKAKDEDPAPEVAEDDKSAPEAAEDDKSAPEVVEDDKPAPEVVEDEKSAPEVVEDDKPAPEVVEDEKSAPEVVEDDKPAPEVVEDEKSAPKLKRDDDPVPGAPKEPEDLTITDRPVDRMIGNKVGDLTTGAYDDTVIITNGGPRTVDTGDGYDIVSVIEGKGNTIRLGKGNDQADVSNTARDTYIDGGEGYDLVDLDGKYSDFHYTQTGENSYVFTRKDDPSIKTTVKSVELVQFADGQLENGKFTPSDSSNIPLGKKPDPFASGGKLGSHKEPEDLTITDRSVTRSIGKLVGDLTTGDGYDSITITAGGPRTVDTGAGHDVVEVLGGEENDIYLGAGQDHIHIAGGNNNIDGGADTDRVHLRNRDDYHFAPIFDDYGKLGVQITNKYDGSTNTAFNVEEFQFANGEVVTLSDLVDVNAQGSSPQ